MKLIDIEEVLMVISIIHPDLIPPNIVPPVGLDLEDDYEDFRRRVISELLAQILAPFNLVG